MQVSVKSSDFKKSKTVYNHLVFTTGMKRSWQSRLAFKGTVLFYLSGLKLNLDSILLKANN